MACSSRLASAGLSSGQNLMTLVPRLLLVLILAEPKASQYRWSCFRSPGRTGSVILIDRRLAVVSRRTS